MLSAIIEGFKIVANKWELVLGIVALVGLLVQKAPGNKVVMGVIKTIVGVLVLKAGSAALLGAFRPAMEILQKAFGLTGVVMDPYGGWVSAMENLGPLVGLAAQIMVFGFIVNIILARITPLHYVYLTGHTMLAFCCFVAWVVRYFFGLDGVGLVVAGSLIAGTYWTILPAWVHRYSRKFAGDSFTLGHMSGVGCIIGSLVGKAVNKPNDSTEELKLPGYLGMFGDNVIATTILMTLFFSGICLLAGEKIVASYAKPDNWALWSMFLGAQFTVGIVVLLTGVRMMLAEIVPAFKGISDKVIPGAIPALDMPVFFPLAPTAAVLGFVSTFAGEFIGMGLLLAVGSRVVTIPGVIPTFFDGGTLGVFANHYGGWKATILAGLLVGVLQMIGGSFLAPLTALKNAVYPNTDYTTVWVILSAVANALKNIWLFMAVFAAIAVFAFWRLGADQSK
ncbi:MAG: PTS ascorbate transporter subunit IIC [Firmicutes bacterium]|nr:PTS ascorbate transporter subunit IIC [Bacillota bacterium]